MVDREKVHSLVRIFYQPSFKTFYINSTDGKTVTGNIGVFVSLGITTSKNTIDRVCEVINNNDEYEAKVVEISSVSCGNKFINCITNSDNPTQYKVEDSSEGSLMDFDQAVEELNRLKNHIDLHSPIEVLNKMTPKISKLKYFIEQLNKTRGWDSHSIQSLDGGEDYRVYHHYLNYKRDGDVEYRLGIYVKKRD